MAPTPATAPSSAEALLGALANRPGATAGHTVMGHHPARRGCSHCGQTACLADTLVSDSR